MNRTFQWEPGTLMQVVQRITALGRTVAVVALLMIRSLLRMDRPDRIGLEDILYDVRWLGHRVLVRFPRPIQAFIRRLK